VNANSPPPSLTLLQMAAGSWISQAIHVAAKLGIADLLADAPKSRSELAVATETNELNLYRVLRTLCSVGVFCEGEDGYFSLTPLAECLRTGVPGSVRSYAIMLGEEWFWRPCGDMFHGVKTGQDPFEHVFGTGLFGYLTQHPDAAALFDDAMTARTAQENRGVVASCDFSGMDTIVDVGGGHGALLTSLLQANEAVRGVLVDLPHVIAGARQHIEAAGLGGRCTLVSGDFFQSVPEGGDAYLLKHVIHDWADDQAVAILQSCRRAMADTARLLLVEMIIPAGNSPFFGKQLDLLMLGVTHGGRERTEHEYRDLLQQAGFTLTSIIPTPTLVSVIEGAPA
jgi:hypothetical protein